jgi:hypothetical protein
MVSKYDRRILPLDKQIEISQLTRLYGKCLNKSYADIVHAMVEDIRAGYGYSSGLRGNGYIELKGALVDVRV